MPRPPLVGITAGNDPLMPEHYVLRWDYVHSVTEAGGVAVILAPSRAAEEPQLLERFDALVLSGGADLHPETYGQSPRTEIRAPSRERDVFELGLARRALEKDLPLFAICRGMQVLNVALGGSLIQDLPTEIGDGIRHDDLDRPRYTLAHDVDITPGSRLEASLATRRITVNSFHHQAIDRLADGLEVTARSEDGVIEAVELPGREVLGVQWHPECFWRKRTFLPLFEVLVQAAERR